MSNLAIRSIDQQRSPAAAEKKDPFLPITVTFTMSDNAWLKTLHSERMKRHGGSDEYSTTTTSPPSSTSSGSSGEKKRKAEVIDLIDNDDETVNVRDKKRKEQEEADEALARRLDQEERNHQLQQANGANATFGAPSVDNNDDDDGFDKLATTFLFQLVSRHDAAATCMRLKAQCGGTLTPRNVLKLGADGLARILSEEKSKKKSNAIVDLARKWSTLPSCPTRRKGPQSQADKHFVSSLTKSPKKGGVAGIGKWTLHTLLEDLGRTDILNADCYEVQQGVRWFARAEKRSAAAVRAFANAQNFRPQSLSQVSAIMRTLHRSVQVILSAGPRKRKTPNAQDRVRIDGAIAHTRNELAGL